MSKTLWVITTKWGNKDIFLYDTIRKNKTESIFCVAESISEFNGLRMKHFKCVPVKLFKISQMNIKVKK